MTLPRRTTIVAAVSAAAVLTLVAASQSYFTGVMEGRPPAAWRAVVPAFVTWFFWVAISPAMFVLVRRVPLRRERWGRAVLVHGAIAVALAFAHGALVVLVNRAVYLPTAEQPVPPFSYWYGRFMLFQFQVELFTYLGVLGIVFAVDYYLRYRRSQVRAADLTAQLSSAHLAALKAQLHPHFLFNTLNAITVLIRDDSERAMRTMAQLGDFLRLTLADPDTQEVELHEELEFLKLYLEIEQTRFPDRLSVRFDVDDAVRNALVPHFVLQPLVENAVRYGVAPHERPGRIVISARRDGDVTTLAVWNDGSRLLPPEERVAGIGLNATTRRLDALYPGAASLALDEEGGGVVARVTLPYHNG